mgnify:CR=1 FL=1
MVSILALDFMVRALLAGALTGVMAPAVGSYIVQRRLSLLGDGLGHVAIAAAISTTPTTTPHSGPLTASSHGSCVGAGPWAAGRLGR